MGRTRSPRRASRSPGPSTPPPALSGGAAGGPAGGPPPPAASPRLQEASARTKQSVAAYARWLQKDVLPKGREVTGIGAAKFRKLLRLRELGMTVEQVYAGGQ